MKFESMKKLYKKPELVVYGDLREVTQGGGNMSDKNDNGNPGKDKTA